jgi:DNA repair exonuclease SbcCD ATPase subunit
MKATLSVMEVTSMKRSSLCGLLLALLAPLAFACASVPPPTDTINAADRAIAEAAQADAEPHARLEMHLARENLEKARAAVDDDRNAEARELAEKALVEAELAEARARSARARANVAEIRDHIEMLRREIDRAPMTSR